ncbi:MAG TPA: aspartate aminotransferase family protein [Candidatus Limnocylindrales bacterium]|nr:aspartate aminotransferase family protein [Candidatus Limnocylindrales bacterium]
MARVEFPQKGMPGEDVMTALRSLKSGDSDWKNGRMFSLIYNAGEDVARVAEDAYCAFVVENGLSPFAFPSLLKMENEVVAMLADLFHGDAEVVGNMTSGGSESIIVAAKAARDYARAKKPHITQPELLMPLSAHPAFNKAAHYLGLKTVIVPTDKKTLAADVNALRQAITDNTVLMIGSAPSYPHGIIDPIADLAEIAAKKDIWMHVDACVGGLILPFVEMLGYPIPTFDFRIPGVCSISADIHKYGFTPKGASAILYRNPELRQHQIFAYADWPGGVYATPNVSGSRPGGPIASSWATLKYLGIDGYLKLHQKSMESTRKLIAGVEAIPGLHVLGKPPATVFAIGSDTLNVFALGERMKEHRWYIDSQHLPPCLHMTISPIHATIVESFLGDLRTSATEVGKLRAEDISGEAAMYGMVGSMTDRSMAKDFALRYMNDLYRVN